jgi:hypothetical protein
MGRNEARAWRPASRLGQLVRPGAASVVYAVTIVASGVPRQIALVVAGGAENHLACRRLTFKHQTAAMGTRSDQCRPDDVYGSASASYSLPYRAAVGKSAQGSDFCCPYDLN